MKNKTKVKKIKEQIKKNEKGAITLYVAVAMLFMLIIAFIMYMQISNKNNAQNRTINSIKNEYDNSMQIEQEYANTIEKLNKEIEIMLYKPTGERYNTNDWTKDDLKMKIYYKNDIPEEKKQFTIDGILKQYQGEYTITKNCVVKAQYDTYKTQVNITKIDKEQPKVNLFPNGGEYKVIGETGTLKTQVKGTDQLSGLKQIKYAWSTSNIEKPEESEYVEIQNGGIITKDYPLGTYYLWIKGIDNVGNIKEIVSNTYTIREPLPPTINLKINNNGAEENYTGNWTKQNIQGEITIPTEEGNVEKYQYSSNNSEWIDIDGEVKSVTLDYKTEFPIQEEGKPKIIGDLQKNSENCFVVEGTTLKSNNTANSSHANSYIPIDLSKYSQEDKLSISINCTISSEQGYDMGYAAITQTTTTPERSSNGKIMYISGATATNTYNIEISGGKMYYLHFGYTKDGSVNKNDDCFIINSLSFKSESLGEKINFLNYTKNNNTIKFVLEEPLNTGIYVKAIYDDGNSSKISNKINLKTDKKAPTVSDISYKIVSRTVGEITLSNITEKESGLRGYYISTVNEEPTLTSKWVDVNENNIVIQNLNVESTYYIWLIDNTGNISKVNTVQVGIANYVVDNKVYVETLQSAIEVASDGSTIKLLNDYTDSTVANINKNITFNLQEYILNRTESIDIQKNKTVELIGDGSIVSSSNNYTISNYGTLNINITGKVENTYYSTNVGAIKNAETLNINSGNISGYYRAIYNYNTLNLYSGKIESTYFSNSSYAIEGGTNNIYGGTIVGYIGIYGNVNMYNGKIEGNGSNAIYGNRYNANIYNGYIVGKTTAISNCSTLNIEGGEIYGDYGIITYGATNIKGGRIEGKTYGVFANKTDVLTIGNIEDKLSITNPSIYGKTYGVYMSDESYRFNFNGGQIMGDSETTYKGVLIPREGYVKYTYYEYSAERKYCTILIQNATEIEITQSPEEFTNKQVKVLVQYPQIDATTKQYSEDGTIWKDVTDNVYVGYVDENKTIYARIINEAGEIQKSKQKEINNIDKINPEVTVVSEKSKYVVATENDKVNITFSISAQDQGVSGIKEKQYAWIEGEGVPNNYLDIVDGKEIVKQNMPIGKYYLWLKVTDNAGNVSEVTKMRFIVEYQQPVAKIGETLYFTIQDAIENCSKEEGSPQTTITILKDTDEESTISIGQNIILDLQGHTVGSSNKENPTFTNEGNLLVIDTSETKNGKIENIAGTAIKNMGTLTIGDNSNTIDNSTPTIYGKTIGVLTTGEFNYYDGTITSKAPISGSVTKIPEGYGPIGEYLNGITTVKLGVVTDYVARIEWVYYDDLQKAINVCKSKSNNTETTTITFIKNIILNETLETYYGQNITIDLNSYQLTENTIDNMINNHAELHIIDNSKEKTGKISIYTTETNENYEIKNLLNGNLFIEGTTITSELSKGANYIDCYSIYNTENANLTIINGVIESSAYNSQSESNAYAIYNNSIGNIVIKNSDINATSNRRGSYAIYNNSKSKIKIEDGRIMKNNSYSNDAYSVYNIGGQIEMTKDIYLESRIYNENGEVYVDGNLNFSKTGYGIENKSGKIILSGNMNIEEDRHFQPSYGIYNYSDGEIEFFNFNMKIFTTNSIVTSYGIYNYGSLICSNASINNSGDFSVYYGIYNGQEGNIKLDNVTINSSGQAAAYGIYNNAKGKITLGNKEDNNVNDEGNIINASTFGIYNDTEGVCYFYDGIISDIYGSITDIPDEYEIVKNTENKIKLSPISENAVILGSNNQEYKTILDAIKDSNVKDTIQVIRDFNIIDNVSIAEEKDITLDLNGYTITEYGKINNNGILTINDTKTTGNITSKGCYGIVNSGKMTILNGTINVKIIGESKNSEYGIYNKSTGIIELNGGTIDAYTYGIYNTQNGSVNVLNGIIKSSKYGIYNETTEKLEIFGGNIKSTSSSGGYAIYNKAGTLEVYQGEIESTTSIKNEDYCKIINGNIKSSKGDVIVGYYKYNCGIENTGTLEMLGGTIDSDSYGIYNYDTNSYGIYNYESGIANIIGGVITATGEGIRNYGNLTLGIKEDGIIDTKNPSISGTYSSNNNNSYGVYNTTGTFNFYDGIIKGDTLAIYNVVTEYEKNTELPDISKEKEVYLDTVVRNEAKIGDTEYLTLQDAINATNEKQTTIELLKGISITKLKESIEIPEGKNIILDMMSSSVISAKDEPIIINNGNLIVKDSLGGSYISGGANSIILNNTTGNLTISDVSITNTKIGEKTNLVKVVDNLGFCEVLSGKISIQQIYTQAVNNKGRLEIKGGTIEANMNCIYNEEEGELKIESGVINKIGTNELTGIYNTYTIYNNSTKNLEITGAEITNDGGLYNNYSIYNANTGDVHISGCKIKSTSKKLQNNINIYGIYNLQSGNIYISESSINMSNTNERVTLNGIYNKSTGYIESTNTNIDITVRYSGYGVYNLGIGEIKLINNSINIESSGYVTGINNYGNGKIQLESGEVKTNSIELSFTESIENYAKGTIVIGKQDNILNKENLKISSKGYGIGNNSGTLEIYDGIISGIKEAVTGQISKIEKDADIIVGTNENLEKVITLEESTTKVASTNGIEYNQLQDAIDACGIEESTIKIINDKMIFGATIKENQNITIDLNGYKIQPYLPIINNGTLKINDYSENKNGIISPIVSGAIINYENLEIIEGTIKDGIYGINNNKNTTIKGGTIENNSSYGINNNDIASLNILGGSIKNCGYGIYLYGKAEIKNCDLLNNKYGIYATIKKETNISHTNIIGGDYGIYLAGGGSINIGEETVINSNIGIKNFSTLNIGEEGNVNLTMLQIIGEEYGISNSGAGKLYFYDGQIKGKVAAIDGIVTATQEGYKVKDSIDGQYNVATLQVAGSVTTVAKIGVTEFSNLQAAINSVVGNDEVTIELVNGIITGETFTIEEGQKVRLDLKGYTISSELEYTINNSGELKIVDTSDKTTSKISSTVASAINNQGSLSIGEDNGTVTQNIPAISGNTYGIINNGTLGFYDGIIEGITDSVNGIVNLKPEEYIVNTRTVNNKKQIYLGK